MDRLTKLTEFTKLTRHRRVAIAAVIAAAAFCATVFVAPALAGRHASGSPPVSHALHTAAHTHSSSPSAVISSSPTVQLVARDLTPTKHLALTAAGFGPNEQLLVAIEDAQGNTYDQQTFFASAKGDLAQTQLALPQQLGPGSYQLVVTGNDSHRTASVTFRMHDVPPAITLATYSARPGQTVSFTGNGFIGGELVTVSLASAGSPGPSKAPLTSVQATGVGAVTGQFTTPALPPGTYTLTLLGENGQTPVSVHFSIRLYAPWVVLDRYYVAPGESIGLIGQDFAPGEQVLVYLNSPRGTPVMHLTADTAGQITSQDSWIPAADVTGQNTLVFVGQSSKATTSVDFTVSPAAQTQEPSQPTPAPSGP